MRLAAGLALLLCACGCSESPAEAGAGEPRGTPQRIVTLAPHLAELVFAAGAGDRLVGVSAYSDYPEAVRELPVVGDAFMLDQEQLALLEPDLLLAWQSGTPAHVRDQLKARGYRVEAIRSRGLDDVATAIERIADLTGNDPRARASVQHYREGLAGLREQWADTTPLRVFYQVSSRPLYTVNGDHYVSELLALCGGRNIFAGLSELAPMVSEEAVLAQNPEVLMAAGDGGEDLFAPWKRWPEMSANRFGSYFVVPPALIGRATPRLLAAGQAVCERLEKARQQRASCPAAGCGPR